MNEPINYYFCKIKTYNEPSKERYIIFTLDAKFGPYFFGNEVLSKEVLLNFSGIRTFSSERYRKFFIGQLSGEALDNLILILTIFSLDKKGIPHKVCSNFDISGRGASGYLTNNLIISWEDPSCTDAIKKVFFETYNVLVNQGEINPNNGTVANAFLEYGRLSCENEILNTRLKELETENAELKEKARKYDTIKQCLTD